MAEAMDKDLALFTGLNAIPKRTAFSEYSVLVDPTLAGPLMHRWQDEAAELSHVLAPGKSIDLNPRTICYHGHPALLQRHYASRRSSRQRGVLTIPGRDADARVHCYADATTRKRTRNDAILRVVNYRQAHTLPEDLFFDRRFTVYVKLRGSLGHSGGSLSRCWETTGRLY